MAGSKQQGDGGGTNKARTWNHGGIAWGGAKHTRGEPHHPFGMRAQHSARSGGKILSFGVRQMAFLGRPGMGERDAEGLEESSVRRAAEGSREQPAQGWHCCLSACLSVGVWGGSQQPWGSHT